MLAEIFMLRLETAAWLLQGNQRSTIAVGPMECPR